MITTVKNLEDFAANIISSGEYQIKKFDETRTKYGLAYAFEWSNDAFDGAAKLAVGKEIQGWLETLKKAGTDEKSFITEAMTEVHRRVIRQARWPERSTSVQSNEMKTRLAAVWGELYAKHSGL